MKDLTLTLLFAISVVLATLATFSAWRDYKFNTRIRQLEATVAMLVKHERTVHLCVISEEE